MFARTATFEGVDVSKAEATMAVGRERATPILEGLTGWQGAMQLLDRENAKMVVLQVFDSRENMEAAESTFETMPQQLGPEIQEMLAGKRPAVDKFEIMGSRGMPDINT
ncbi:hypothetical protein BH18ACT12_BH18ACT12_00670 [soil metagenome]